MDPSTHEVKGRTVSLPSKAVRAVNARLKVGEFDKSISVFAGQKEVVYKVPLAAGEQKIQTWLTTHSGEKTAAYYVYIEPQ